MSNKKKLLNKLLIIGYDNPKLADLSEKTLIEILNNNDSFYKRNSYE
ncbi:hypothetical protein OAH24_01345 [Gammaproteobacteria bacterium]|nr:hypothetical protein [SAR86 cluster bacterium]MDA7554137.1 hypothetical protein [Gammaproteobacteria bacterium]MDB4816022.1 hypothetical protein [Gammaproteobacteria bacterium]